MKDTLGDTAPSLMDLCDDGRPPDPGRLLQIHPVDILKAPFSVPRSGLTIGRGEQCELTLHDDAVSRQHLRIEHRGDFYVAVDLGSTNGTFVNDRPIREQLIVPGDRIRVGTYIFKLISADAFESQYYDAVYSMMTEDGLTGAINRRAFRDILRRETLRSLNTHRPLALVLFDVDHFKSINDTHGHLIGDQILQELARRLRELVESHVVVARYGGEEFAILIPELDASQAVDVAERCRIAIGREPFQTAAGPILVTVSLGVAVTSDIDPESPEPDQALIAAADDRLYRAKRSGRNRVTR